MDTVVSEVYKTQLQSNKPSQKKKMTSNNGDHLSPKAIFYMFLLSIQFGIQPILTKRFTPPSVCRSSVILVQEGVKFIIASSMLYSSGQFKTAISSWSLSSWLKVAALPAALYSIQNLAALLAYQNLDALTFNVLNQTKTLSAAMCCFLVMGKMQSKVQVCSLFVLLGSALVIEKIITIDFLFSLFYWSSLTAVESETQLSLSSALDAPEKKTSWMKNIFKIFSKKPSSEDYDVNMSIMTDEVTTRINLTSRHFTHGVAPVLLASFISGLAGALSQKNLQSSNTMSKKNIAPRNPFLFSMELCAASTIFLCITLFTSEDGKFIYNNGFFKNWTVHTLIPIVTNACGGIIVGLVTKYAGSVRKGFALIFGILLSGVMQAMVGIDDLGVSKEKIVGGLMAGFSLWAHATHPYTSTSLSLSSNVMSTSASPLNAKSETDDVIRKNIRRATRKARKED